MEEEFVTCTLCPGICNIECPVYRGTYRRAAAPSSIGRAGLALLRQGPGPSAEALLYCTGCGSCRDYCPLGNDLPEAARRARRLLTGVRGEALLRRTRLHEGSRVTVTVVSPRRPPGGFAAALQSLGYGLVWLDSSEATPAYWRGAEPPRANAEGIISTEDLDAPLERAVDTAVLVDKLGLRLRRIPAYALHVPCKDRSRDAYDILRRMIGEPAVYVEGCSGAPLRWTGLREAGILVSRIAEASRGLPVVTTCAWTALALASAGVKALTPLDLVVDADERD